MTVETSVKFCVTLRTKWDKKCYTFKENITHLQYNLVFGLQVIDAIGLDVDVTVYRVMEVFQQNAFGQLLDLNQILKGDNIEVRSFIVGSNTQCNSSVNRDIFRHQKLNRSIKRSPLKKDKSQENGLQYICNIQLFADRIHNRTNLEKTLVKARNMLYNITVENGTLVLKSFPYDSPIDCKDRVSYNTCKVSLPENKRRIPETNTPAEVNKMLFCALKKVDSYPDMIIEELCSKGFPYQLDANKTVLKLCESDWLMLNLKPNDNEILTLQMVHGIFSLILTLCSLVCLIITFFTYMCFKSMRTIPGKNNISLVFNLFWAQALTQFGIHQTKNPLVCTIVSIVTHYFWLASFCAMNICSFHMFRVFTSSLYSSLGRSKRTVVQYCFYIYTSPGIAISVYILIKLMVDGSQNLGYGGDVCFISDRISILIVLVTPAGLIILSNVILSGLAYWHIRSSPHVRCNAERRNDFKIYIRLLTVTGIAWPLIFLDILLPLSVFSFIALFANAMQGVFIFFAFICNKRVLHMYKLRSCKRCKHVSKSSQTYSARLKSIEQIPKKRNNQL